MKPTGELAALADRAERLTANSDSAAFDAICREIHDSLPDGVRPVNGAVRDYCRSLDAASTLVPEGCAWTAGYGQTLADDPMGAAVVGRNAEFIGYKANYDPIAHGEGATPALALCVAALRARAASCEAGA